MKNIIVTGGNGRFASSLKKYFYGENVFYLSKKEFDVTKIKNLEKKIKKIKPKTILHLAALSRPLDIHEKNIAKSIDINIVGTCNLVKLCKKFKIKLIYMSSHYVYPCIKGNYKETDALLPSNNYSWSKLGGESSVQMYENSLILRVCMTEKPFVHKKAFYDFTTNFIFHDEVAKILFKLINKKGIINVGGKTQTVYKFVKSFNPKIKKIFAKKLTFFRIIG